jgi:hypothetical protein
MRQPSLQLLLRALIASLAFRTGKELLACIGTEQTWGSQQFRYLSRRDLIQAGTREIDRGGVRPL